MSRRLVVPAALALAVAAMAPEGRAYTPSEARWATSALPVPYRVNASSAPASIGAAGGLAAVDAGFASWQAPTCTRWRATNAGATSVVRASARDGVNTISWIQGSWPGELGSVSVTIGVTTPVYRVGGSVIDADIQFNAVGFTWSTDGRRGTVDTQSIATHEEGHFLGLDHSSSRAAVMFASYGGGQLRALSSDDIAGVCAIYPSGGPVPDAGTSTDPCSRYTSCDGCTPVDGCGWCGASGRCLTSTMSGPTAGSCGGGFAWLPRECTAAPPVDSGTPPPVDAGTTDPCNRFTTCEGCTPYDGCGWCGAAGRCVRSTMTGPVAGTCASGFAWVTSQCGGTTGGTAAFGERCASPTDCASGGFCVRTPTSAFCSRSCTDDCTCPRGYRCAMTTTAGLSVCVPGANACTPATDSGVTPPADTGVAPPRDTGVAPPRDTGRAPDVAGDTGATPEADAETMTDAGAEDGGAMPVTGTSSKSGCGCSTADSVAGRRAPWLLALGLAAVAARRRRRG